MWTDVLPLLFLISGCGGGGWGWEAILMSARSPPKQKNQQGVSEICSRSQCEHWFSNFRMTVVLIKYWEAATVVCVTTNYRGSKVFGWGWALILLGNVWWLHSCFYRGILVTSKDAETIWKRFCSICCVRLHQVNSKWQKGDCKGLKCLDKHGCTYYNKLSARKPPSFSN